MVDFLPIITLGMAGVAFGIVFGLLSKRLGLFHNSKIETVCACLPAIDCGACGFDGCRGFAEAVVQNRAGPCDCVPGGPLAAHAIADILGTIVLPAEASVAVVHCKGGLREAAQRYSYDGIADCHAAVVAGGGPKACADGCLGLGSCAAACPFGAIAINENGTAFVNDYACVGCGACIGACPRNIIGLIPRVHKIYIACSNHDRGTQVRKYCSRGCTACGRCIRATQSGAIRMIGNIPVLDYTKEENYIVAACKCPSGSFADLARARPKVTIDAKCDGCGECAMRCPVEAITGEQGLRHVVDKKKCIGCGICLSACPQSAIFLLGGGPSFRKDNKEQWAKP